MSKFVKKGSFFDFPSGNIIEDSFLNCIRDTSGSITVCSEVDVPAVPLNIKACQ